MKSSIFLFVAVFLAVASPLYAKGGKARVSKGTPFVSGSVDSDGNKTVCVGLPEEKVCATFDKKNRFSGGSVDAEIPVYPGISGTASLDYSNKRVTTCVGVKAGMTGLPLGAGTEVCLEAEEEGDVCARARLKANVGPVEASYETDCYDF